MRSKGDQPASQLALTLEAVGCKYYEECAAPLCPKDVDFGTRIWFPNEPVCRLRVVPDWVHKQRKIARLPGIDSRNYLTLRMLNSIQRVSRGLQGANPDLVTGERIWLAERSGAMARRRAKKADSPAPEAGQSKEGAVWTYPLF